MKSTQVYDMQFNAIETSKLFFSLSLVALTVQTFVM